MKKKYRVKKNEEIEAILKNRLSFGNKYFIVYKKTNDETNYFRYAISVGKKIGNAVIRNRVKRQIRSIIDNMCDLSVPLDVFVVVSKKIIDIDYQTMDQQLKYLFKKMNIKTKGDQN